MCSIKMIKHVSKKCLRINYTGIQNAIGINEINLKSFYNIKRINTYFLYKQLFLN